MVKSTLRANHFSDVFSQSFLFGAPCEVEITLEDGDRPRKMLTMTKVVHAWCFFFSPRFSSLCVFVEWPPVHCGGVV